MSQRKKRTGAPLAALLFFLSSPTYAQVFNYLDPPVDVTPAVAGSWQDVDVTAYTSSDATGVLVEWVETTGSNWDFGIRKKGSTDPFFNDGAAKGNQQGWLMTGLDAGQVFQVYTGNTGVKAYLIGYTRPGAWFFTNRIDKSLGSTGSWQDIDISADTGSATAIGAIFAVHNINGASQDYGLRKKGSTDSRLRGLRADIASMGIIGVDAGEVCQGNIALTDVDFYLVGFVTSGAVFFTNALNKSTVTTGSYVDVDITADIGANDANGAIVEVDPSDNTRRNVALRQNGATYDYYREVSHQYALVGVDAGDIFEQKIQLATMDLYMIGYTLGDPTAVELASFGARAGDGAVELLWETASELDNLGFHLYRSTSPEGPYARITERAIIGLGSSPSGARYSHQDQGLSNGVTYYYKLEDIETTGKRKMHGPVEATPREGAAVESRNTRITVGRPGETSLKVLSRGPNELVLELRTGGFHAELLRNGSVRLDVPGFTPTENEGFPRLPVKRSWIPVAMGRNVKLSSVESLEEETFEGIRPESAGQTVVEASERTVRLTHERRRRSGNLAAAPGPSARLLQTAIQQEVQKALVELAPVRWDGTRERLVLSRRLLVRLSFEGRVAEDRPRDTLGRRRRASASQQTGAPSLRLVTHEAGLHGVTFEDLFGLGRRSPFRADSLRLSRQGRTVPFYVKGETFAPGESLYFLSQGAAANPYGGEAVYELQTGVDGERMRKRDAAPGGEATSIYWERVEKEENVFYQAALPDPPDRWLWKLLYAPARERFPFEVSAPGPGSARLRVRLQGTSDFPEDPDHHVRVFVNGAFAGERSWNGKWAERIEVELPEGLLHQGENSLEVENVGDTEAAYSMVGVDGYELSYPRMSQAVAGKLEGVWSASGAAEIGGVSQALVVERTDQGLAWLDGVEPGPSRVRFRAEAGAHYTVVHPDQVMKVAEVRRVAPGRLKDVSQIADYVIIGPREFLGAAAALVELRHRQGLRVKTVAVEEIFSEFGFGESDPRAIREFLTFAYHEWKRGPRYVLLLGDATYDFKGYLGAYVTNRVPPLMIRTSYLETVSDPAYAAVNGDDLLPDLAIGRLPAATQEELSVMLSKILAYETSERRPSGRAVIVADNPDGAGDFVADAESLASGILGGRGLEKIYLSELGAAAARERIRRAFDEGSSLMNYIGHGSISLWADENLLNGGDVQFLAPQREQPLLLTMNCLNGYFHFPYANSLAEELLKADGKGVIAAFSPSGLSVNDAAHVFHEAMLEELLSRRHRRLGDVVLAAQSTYADSGALPELMAIYHLFGDPAMVLR